MNLKDEQIEALYAAAKHKPRVFFRDSQVISREEIVERNEVITEGKFRITVKEVTTVTRETIIREYDPDNSYEDGLHEFIQPNEVEVEVSDGTDGVSDAGAT